ncbi:MAG: DUF2490 domain-containing protein [Gammaproteobacteria bacterium]
MSRALRLAALLALATGAALPASADTAEDFHTWGAVIATGPLGGAASRARFWAEGQGRFEDDSSRRFQGFLRVAGGWLVAPRTVLWAGYGYFNNDAAGVPEDTVEHRIWQQLTWAPAQALAGFALSSRTRLEQRQVESADDVGWRARQLFKLTRPLGAAGRVYLSLWDELFVNIDDADWGAAAGFDQNRVFAGLGAHLAPRLRGEVGYMNQYVRRAGREDASNHVLSLTLFLDF